MYQNHDEMLVLDSKSNMNKYNLSIVQLCLDRITKEQIENLLRKSFEFGDEMPLSLVKKLWGKKKQVVLSSAASSENDIPLSKLREPNQTKPSENPYKLTNAMEIEETEDLMATLNNISSSEEEDLPCTNFKPQDPSMPDLLNFRGKQRLKQHHTQIFWARPDDKRYGSCESFRVIARYPRCISSRFLCNKAVQTEMPESIARKWVRPVDVSKELWHDKLKRGQRRLLKREIKTALRTAIQELRPYIVMAQHCESINSKSPSTVSSEHQQVVSTIISPTPNDKNLLEKPEEDVWIPNDMDVHVQAVSEEDRFMFALNKKEKFNGGFATEEIIIVNQTVEKESDQSEPELVQILKEKFHKSILGAKNYDCNANCSVVFEFFDIQPYLVDISIDDLRLILTFFKSSSVCSNNQNWFAELTIALGKAGLFVELTSIVKWPHFQSKMLINLADGLVISGFSMKDSVELLLSRLNDNDSASYKEIFAIIMKHKLLSEFSNILEKLITFEGFIFETTWVHGIITFCYCSQINLVEYKRIMISIIENHMTKEGSEEVRGEVLEWLCLTNEK